MLVVVLKHKRGGKQLKVFIMPTTFNHFLGYEIRISTAHWTEMKPWKQCFWETKNRAHTLLSCKVRQQFDFLWFLISYVWLMPTSSKNDPLLSEICSRNFVPRVIVWQRAGFETAPSKFRCCGAKGVVNNWRSSSRHLILKSVYIQPLFRARNTY